MPLILDLDVQHGTLCPTWLFCMCCQRHLLAGEFLYSFKDSKIILGILSDLQGDSLGFRNAYIKLSNAATMLQERILI